MSCCEIQRENNMLNFQVAAPHMLAFVILINFIIIL